MTKNLPKSNSLLWLFVWIAAAGFCMQACKKDESKTEPVPVAKPELGNASKVNRPVQQQLSAVVASNPVANNKFDFSAKKDPFKPLLMAKKAPVPVFTRRRSISGSTLPIHSFDVNRYKVIGIITGIRENQAMVTDPNGKGYVVKVGMTIGKNEGRITSISSNSVTVLEQFIDNNGRVRKEFIKINLPRK